MTTPIHLYKIARRVLLTLILSRFSGYLLPDYLLINYRLTTDYPGDLWVGSQEA